MYTSSTTIVELLNESKQEVSTEYNVVLTGASYAATGCGLIIFDTIRLRRTVLSKKKSEIA
jgi:hypothetical protein